MRTAPNAAPQTELPAMTTLDVIYAVRQLKDPRLACRHKAVLFALASFRERDGTIAPSNGQLVEATCESRSTVFRTLSELEEWGFLARTHRGQHASSVYVLTLSAQPQRCQPETSQPRTSQPGTSQPRTQRCQAGTPEVSGWDPLRISPEDLPDPSGGAPSAPTVPVESEVRLSGAQIAKGAGVVHGVGKIIAAYRDGYRERYGGEVPDTSHPRVGKAANELLASARGDVSKALEIVRNGIVNGERELHHIARDANKHRVRGTASRRQFTQQRGIGVETHGGF